MATKQNTSPQSAGNGLATPEFPFAFAPADFLRMPALGAPVAAWAELLRFTAHRLEAQADFLQRLCRCADLPEAIRQQSAFIDTAMSDYASEAATMAAKAQEGFTAAA